MKRLFVIVAAMVCLACGSSAETLDPIFDSILIEAETEEAYDAEDYQKELIKAYGGENNKKFQDMHRQFDEYEQRSAEYNAKRTANRWLTFLLSLMMALFPTCVVLVQAIKGEFQPADKAAVWRTVGLLVGYGIVLFALNYIWLWTMFTGETKIMGAVLGLCLAAFVIFAIHTLRKSKKK
ncbi:MAG: hypothetical protein K6F10_02880 [Paludibacteraceae bacterium]|nr:hypothetical protein [Paludibacteraceae bacterium]